MNNKINLYLTVILVFIFFISCEDRSVQVTEMIKEKEVAAIVVGGKSSESFKKSYDEGKHFLNLFRQGKKFRKQKEYKKSIVFFKDALELADNRSFTGMALRQLAGVYEDVEEYEKAIYIWKYMVEFTLNIQSREEYLEKIRELEKKIDQNK